MILARLIRLTIFGSGLCAEQLKAAEAEDLRPLEIQLRRAVGLREGNERQLIRAAEIAESIGAVSPLARVRYELARMGGDSAGMAASIGTLEAMGDNRQIALYEG